MNRPRRVLVGAVVAALAGAPLSAVPLVRAATSSAATVPADGFDWQRLADPALAAQQGGGFGDVAATDAGFLAAGWITDSSGVPRPSAWSSADGTTWTTLALSSPEHGGLLYDVAAQADTSILVGDTGYAPDGTYEPLVYRVAGGTAERITDSDFAANTSFTHVIANPAGGFLLLGALGTQTLAFQSSDGVEWVPEAGLAGLIGGLNDPLVTDLAAGPLGRIAVLTDGRGAIEAGVLYVDAGGGFLPATLPETADVDLGRALVTDTHFWVYGALRGQSDYTSAIWRSADGTTWERITPQITVGEAHSIVDTYGTYFHGAVATPQGFAGVVYEQSVWLFVSSTDGVAWSEIPIDGEVLDLDVPPVGGLAYSAGVVAGTSGPAGTRHALFRVAETATQVIDLQLPGGTVESLGMRVAVVADHLMIATVREDVPQDLAVEPARHSDIWTVAPDLRVTAPGPIVDYVVSDIHASDDGALSAVGYEWFLPKFYDVGAIDAVAWTAAPNQAVATAPVGTQPDQLTTRMHAVSGAGPGLMVAVGSNFPHDDGPDYNTTRPLFWRSADGGRTWQDAAVDPAARLANFTAIDACALPGGGAIAIGEYAGAVADQPAVYRTVDGTTWTLTASAASAFGSDSATLFECVTTPTGVVIVGASGSPSRSGVWRTTDGTSFAPLAVPDGGEGSSWNAVHATADGRLWLAGEAITDPSSAELHTVLVEVDAAGTAQPPVALTGDPFQSTSGYDGIWYVTSFGDHLALVGAYAGGIGVWTSPLPPAAASAPQPTAPASQPTTAAPTPTTAAPAPTPGPTTSAPRLRRRRTRSSQVVRPSAWSTPPERGSATRERPDG